MDHRATADRLLRAALDETDMQREKVKRLITAALADAYEAGRVTEQQRVRAALLASAGLK